MGGLLHLPVGIVCLGMAFLAQCQISVEVHNAGWLDLMDLLTFKIFQR